MINKKYKVLKSYIVRNRVVTNMLIFTIGVTITIVGATIFKYHGTLNIIMISVGASIIASIIIASLSLFYIYEHENKQDIYNEWGLVAIYKTRSEMNVSTAESFITMTNNFDIIAFGMKSLRDAKGDLFIDKVKSGLKVRILSIDPESEFLRQRELDEKRNPGDIMHTIYLLKEWVDELKAHAPNKNNVNIRFYNTLPLDHYCRQDNSIYVGPYMYGIDSQQTISFEYEIFSKGFDYYSNYFEKLWNDGDIIKNI